MNSYNPGNLSVRGERAGQDSERPPLCTAADAGFSAVLRASGMHAALALLNSRTRFRFTGLYHMDPPLLRNVYLYDRENPLLDVGGDIRMLEDTYCSMVLAAEHAIQFGDALADPRLRDHPAQTSVLSYMGVPVRTSGGCLYGTLCHYDIRPRLLPAGEHSVLELAARDIGVWLSDR